MALSDPYFIFGYVRKQDGSPAPGYQLHVVDVDNFQGLETAVTRLNGYYQLNIQDICNNGDTVSISVVQGDLGMSEEFTVDVNTIPSEKSINLRESIKTGEYSISTQMV